MDYWIFTLYSNNFFNLRSAERNEYGMSTHDANLISMIQSSKNPAIAMLAAIKVFEAFSKMPEMSPEQVLAYLLEDREMISALKEKCAFDRQAIA